MSDSRTTELIPRLQGNLKPWIEICLTAFAAYLLVAIPTLFFGPLISVWPAAGVAFAAAFLGGGAGITGIFLATIVANLSWAIFHHHFIGSGMIGFVDMALGNTVGSLAACLVLKRVLKLNDPFSSRAGTLSFCTIGAGTFAAFTAGITGLSRNTMGKSMDVLDLFLRDYVGVLILAPLIILCITRRGKPLLQTKRGEVLFLTLFAIFLTALLFGPGYESIYPPLRIGVFLLVPLFWVANRFELRISTALTFLCFLLVLKGTSMGYGIYAELFQFAPAMMRVQVFFGIIGIILLITGASAESSHRVEAKLHRAFENTNQLIASANVLIIGLDSCGEPKLLNRMAEEITGYSKEELWGNDWFEKIRIPAGTDGDQNPFSGFKNITLLAPNFETVIRTKSGQQRVIAWQTSSLSSAAEASSEDGLEAGGDDIAVICYGIDITQRRQAEMALRKSAEQIQDLYEKAPCGYHSIDAAGVILRINETFLNWLGYTREEVLEKNIRQLLLPSCLAQFESCFADLKEKGEVKDVELEMICKNGSVIPIGLSSTAIRNSSGEFLMSRSTSYDLTERRRANAQLREARNFLDSIIDNIPNMVFVKEVGSLRFMRINRAGEKLLGLSREQLLGKNDYDFFPKQEADAFTAKDREVLASGELLDIPEEPIHTTEGIRLLHTKKIPVSDAAGRVQYLLGISDDITERRRAKEELDRFFNLSIDLFCIAGFDGYFKRVNPAWEALLGFSREELLAVPFLEFVHPDDREATIAEANKLSQGHEVLSFENRYRCKNGSYRWLLWQSRSVPGEGIIYAAAHDCTERKNAEQALKALTEDLKRSNEELEQFAYVASHDLQEPLRMVGSYTMLLGQRYKGQLDPDADKYIEYAVKGSKRMHSLIQDLLTYSRVGSNGNRFEMISSEVVLKEVLETLRLAIRDAQAEVTYDPLPEIFSEPVQLSQLFQNLVGNAIKFHGDAPPKVHLSAKRGRSEWIFSVRDNGIGISPEYYDRIFTIFQRLHSRDKYEGTGIGLAVCKKIVQRHGGRIWVESAANGANGQGEQGTVFYFAIPDRPINIV